MAQSVWGGSNPPDNSGNWLDTGWGYWTQKGSGITGSKIPDGYFDDGWGVILPVNVASNLDSSTVESVNTTIKEAKAFDDTKVGRVLSQVLSKGTSFLNLLQGFGVIKNPSESVSYNNIDKAKTRQLYDSGALNQFGNLEVKPPASVSTSTYFGIDFSKPLNLILVGLALWGIYQLIQIATKPNYATVNPVQSINQNQSYRGRSRRLSLAA